METNKYNMSEQIVRNVTLRNIGSRKICNVGLGMGEYRDNWGGLSSGVGAGYIDFDRPLAEYAVIFFQYDNEYGQKVVKQVNLKDVIPQEAYSNILDLYFNINSDTNEVTVAYEITDMKTYKEESKQRQKERQRLRKAREEGENDPNSPYYRKPKPPTPVLGECVHILEGHKVLYKGSLDALLPGEKKSIDFYNNIGSRSGVAKAYCELGMLYNVGGKPDMALECWRKALDIFNELGNADYAAKVNKAITDLEAENKQQ